MKIFFDLGGGLIGQSEALDGLCNEFTIKNLNSFPLRYKLVTCSQASSGVAEATNSRSAFKFTQAMYDSHLCQNRADTNQMTELIVDLSGEQEMVVKLRFEPPASAAPLHSCLRISAVGYTDNFRVKLVGFTNRRIHQPDECHLKIVRVPDGLPSGTRASIK